MFNLELCERDTRRAHFEGPRPRRTRRALCRPLICLAALVALVGACSDDYDDRAPAAGAGGDRGDTIPWGACPDDFTSECATVPLPLDHARPTGETLPIFVSRHRAAGAARAQMWMLQGGPGASGASFKDAIERLFAPLMPDVDIYVAEHRGVGLSSRLGCPVEEGPGSEQGALITDSEWPACIESLKDQWGDALEHFTTTADAEDVAGLIERAREPGKKVFVYGYSYGTMRALRLMQTHPELVDGVILDSIASPGVEFVSQYDLQFDPVAKELATLCAADPVCGAKLGADPWATLTGVVAKLDAGHCAAVGLDGQALRQIYPFFVRIRELRAHLFPLVYRLERCHDGDVAALQHYVGVLTPLLQGAERADRDSVVLQFHVSLSEGWEEPAPSAAELQARCASQTFCPGIAVSAAPIFDRWPRYAHDQYVNQWPSSSVPVLAMNGTLDPQTPIGKARAAADRLTAPHQTFVEVPFSPHGVAFESPVKTPGQATCGAQMMKGFIADPTAAPDTSCLGDLVPVQFTSEPAEVRRYFGTTDPWE
ncbi:alpha/beta fold hydrolase [Sorangium sp. So ce854]|uniref:alpha/beta hydrolase n=1 Tax=Sorangium sp. So ce854 TaxID=3133322 RepID=UPI003F5E9779